MESYIITLRQQTSKASSPTASSRGYRALERIHKSFIEERTDLNEDAGILHYIPQGVLTGLTRPDKTAIWFTTPRCLTGKERESIRAGFTEDGLTAVIHKMMELDLEYGSVQNQDSET